MIRIAVCDDQKECTNTEKEMVEKYIGQKGYHIQADVFFSGNTLLDAYEKNPYDLTLLDIVMPEENEMDIARHLRSISNKLEIILITAFIDYSLEGYMVCPIGYVLKSDMMEESLNASLDIFISRYKDKELRLKLQLKDGIRGIIVDNIIYTVKSYIIPPRRFQ